MTLGQLDEEIKQLSERIEQITDFVESTKAILKAAEEERDRLADQQKELNPKFERVKENTPYFSLFFDSLTGLIVSSSTEKDIGFDKAAYDNNNYFHTKERAQEVADKINFLLKLERLHDTFCPDYMPDWNDGENKYFVFYDNTCKRYAFNAVAVVEYEPTAYFSTGKIAKKVCDILNAEQEVTA